MYQRTVRYHVSFGTHRSTVSVDTLLSELLAVKLEETPGTPDATRAVTAWLQEQLPANLGHSRSAAKGASYWARRLIIEVIADKRIHRHWEDWYLETNR